MFPVKKAQDSKDTMFTLAHTPAGNGQNGLIVKFSLNSMEIPPMEYNYFLKYIRNQSLYIHIFDFEKKMKMGSVCVPLQMFERHEMQSSVTFLREYDIIEKLEDVMLRDSRDYSAKRRGKLHLRVANIGKKTCKFPLQFIH